MKDFYIVGNWKMHPATLAGARKLAQETEQALGALALKKNVHIVVCPSLVHMAAVTAKKDGRLALGAQNCHYEDEGAFTGEVSAKMLKDAGCTFCLVGHSERRRYNGEDNALINKKIKALLRNGIRPILAIGEERRNSFDEKGVFTGELDPALKDQIVEALAGVSAEKVKKILIAYEPVWAIGSGHAADADDVLSVRIFIKKVLRDLYPPTVEKSIAILYGGSSNAKNTKSFLQGADMDGLLVGGASLKPKEFATMAGIANELSS